MSRVSESPEGNNAMVGERGIFNEDKASVVEVEPC
jgi:hypothetical protein